MIKIAILGTGAISGSHIEAYLKFKDRCKIVALVDKFADKAQAKIDEYKLTDAKSISDYKQLITMEDKPDLVSLCLPPSLHCEMACTLLENGIGVICEKPLAPTLEECDKMIAAAKKGKAMLSTVAQNRFKPDCVKIRELIKSGIMGKPLSTIVTSLWWRGENYYNLSWRGTWQSEGGGCTLIHGIHHIDLFLSLMGKVKDVTAVVDNKAHTNSEVEDISMSLVHFENGAVGSVISSLLHHGEEQKLYIDCEKASVELPLKISANSQLENGFPEENKEMLDKCNDFIKNIEPEYTAHIAQIDDCLTAFENHRDPFITGEDGRRAIEFIAAVYQSAFLKKTVTLPLTEKDPFYSKDGIMKYATKFYEKSVSIDNFQNDKIQVGGTL